MYAPEPYFSNNPAVARTLIERIVMGTLVTSQQDLMGSPLPFMVEQTEQGNLKLISHMDKRNPLWQQFSSDQQILVMFWGPNTYVSPSIYTTRPRVPTWLYVTTHIKGIPRLIQDQDKVCQIVTSLSQYMEPTESAWDITQVTDYRNRLLGAIVGFEIEVDSVISQIRLAQQNSHQDHLAVYNALNKGSLADKQVAELMEQMDVLSETNQN